MTARLRAEDLARLLLTPDDSGAVVSPTSRLSRGSTSKHTVPVDEQPFTLGPRLAWAQPRQVEHENVLGTSPLPPRHAAAATSTRRIQWDSGIDSSSPSSSHDTFRDASPRYPRELPSHATKPQSSSTLSADTAVSLGALAFYDEESGGVECGLDCTPNTTGGADAEDGATTTGNEADDEETEEDNTDGFDPSEIDSPLLTARQAFSLFGRRALKVVPGGVGGATAHSHNLFTPAHNGSVIRDSSFRGGSAYARINTYHDDVQDPPPPPPPPSPPRPTITSARHIRNAHSSTPRTIPATNDFSSTGGVGAEWWASRTASPADDACAATADVTNQPLLPSTKTTGILLATPCGDSTARSFQPPLHAAAADCSPRGFAALQALLMAGADPTQKDGAFHRRTPLHVAAAAGHTRALALLLDAGAWEDLFVGDSEGNTPLHAACAGRGEAAGAAVELLLSHGGDASAINNAGRAPVHCVATAAALAPLIAVRGEECFTLRTRDEKNLILLHIIAASGDAELLHSALQVLLDAPSSPLYHSDGVNAVDGRGCTALHWAAAGGHIGCIALLLRSPHCDPTLLDNSGHTALELAVSGGYPAAVAVLGGTGSSGGATSVAAAVEKEASVEPAEAASEDGAAPFSGWFPHHYEVEVVPSAHPVGASTSTSPQQLSLSSSLLVDTEKNFAPPPPPPTSTQSEHAIPTGENALFSPSRAASAREDEPPHDYLALASSYASLRRYREAALIPDGGGSREAALTPDGGGSREDSVACVTCSRRHNRVRHAFLPCAHACVCPVCLEEMALAGGRGLLSSNSALLSPALGRGSIAVYPHHHFSSLSHGDTNSTVEGVGAALLRQLFEGGRQTTGGGALDGRPWSNCPVCMSAITHIVPAGPNVGQLADAITLAQLAPEAAVLDKRFLALFSHAGRGLRKWAKLRRRTMALTGGWEGGPPPSTTPDPAATLHVYKGGVADAVYEGAGWV